MVRGNTEVFVLQFTENPAFHVASRVATMGAKNAPPRGGEGGLAADRSELTSCCATVTESTE
jgi:hypothetical protein